MFDLDFQGQTFHMKVIQWMCVTLNSKVNRQGHGIVFNIFDILDLENVRIDTMQDQLCIMFTTGDMKGHTKRCLALIFKVMQ